MTPTQIHEGMLRSLALAVTREASMYRVRATDDPPCQTMLLN